MHKEDEFVEKIDLYKLLMICHDPYLDSVWFEHVGPLNMKEVLERSEGIMYTDYSIETPWTPDSTRQDHTDRVAWFVINGWTDPIQIDFGCPSFCEPAYPVIDGHHRIAAAIARDDDWIFASTSGEEDYIQQYIYRG